MTIYTNKTGYTVKIKDNQGNVSELPHGKSSTKAVSVKYPFNKRFKNI